jgi:outer membrane receptor for ferrienterochelin and colicins
MRDLVKILLAGLLLGLPVFNISAQTTITLFDSKSGEPVSFAHVCFESMDKSVINNLIADDRGVVIFDKDLPFQLAATAVGYATLIDTILVSGSYTLYMDPSIFDLEGVVITAQYSPTRADQSIYNVKVINDRVIRQRGVSDLSQALEYELGIRTRNDAALGTSLSIQGLTGEHVKILIDGVPVIGRQAGNIDLSQINMHNVDHIEVVEGPMSVVYGSNALAGAINIITKDNARGKLSAWANAYIESVGVYNFDLGGAVGFGRSSVSLAGSRNFFSGFSDPDTSRTKLWKPRLQYNLDGYYKFSDERFDLKIDLSYFDETIQNKGPLLPPFYEKAYDTWYYTKRLTDRIETAYRISEGRKVDMNLAHSLYSRSTRLTEKDLTTLEEISSKEGAKTEFTGFLIRSTFTDEEISKKISYQAGTDIQLEKGEGPRILDGTQSIGDYAVFASMIYEPRSVVSLQPGIRYAYNTKYDAPLVPSINLRYQPRSTTQVFRASYARGFRAPSLKELYLDFIDINHNLEGNPELKAEYSHNFNLTWDYNRMRRTNRYTYHAGFFYNSVHDHIDLAVYSATSGRYINADMYRTAGGKLSFKYSLHPRFTAQIGLFQVARQSIRDAQNAVNTPFRFSTDVNANTGYHWIGRNIRFLINYKYTGRVPQYVYTDDDEIIEGFRGDYHMLDVTLSKGWWQDRLTLGIGANNLLNYTNIEAIGLSSGAHTGGSGGYPVGWGRSYFVSLRFNFQKF